MTIKEQGFVEQVRFLEAEGLLTAYEAQWCIDALNNRHDLSKPTRHQLRDTVLEMLDRAKSRL